MNSRYCSAVSWTRALSGACFSAFSGLAVKVDLGGAGPSEVGAAKWEGVDVNARLETLVRKLREMMRRGAMFLYVVVMLMRRVAGLFLRKIEVVVH